MAVMKYKAEQDNTCVIYTRISMDVTGEGAGVERQESDCRKLAELRGWEVVAVYTDNDRSAFSGKARPEFERMLRDKPTRVIVFELDRLVRRMTELGRVIDAGISVFTTAGGTTIDLADPSGVAFAQVRTAFSELEGRLKGRRQKAMHIQRREQGRFWWSVDPKGFRTVGEGRTRKIELVPEEAEAIAEFYARFIAGATLAALAEDANALGWRSRKGASFTSDTMRRLLLAPRNAGLVEDQEGNIIATSTEVEPIVSEETWRAAVAIIEGRRLNPDKRSSGPTPTALLASLASCSACGGLVMKSTVWYKCRKGHGKWPLADVDRAVTAFAHRAMLSEHPERYRARSQDPDGAERAQLLEEMKALTEQAQEAAELFTARAINGAQLATISRELQAREEEAASRFAALSNEPQEADRDPDPEGIAGLLRAGKKVEEVWRGMTLTQRREVVARAYTIELRPRGKGVRGFDASKHVVATRKGDGKRERLGMTIRAKGRKK